MHDAFSENKITMRMSTSSRAARYLIAALGIIVACWLELQLAARLSITRAIRNAGVYLGTFNSYGYGVPFPPEEGPPRRLKGYPEGSEALGALVAPNGRSLFYIKQVYSKGPFLLRHFLMRRPLHGSVGAEELIASSFIIQYFAVSLSERLVVFAGRVRDDAQPNGGPGGIVLWNRDTNRIELVAPFEMPTDGLVGSFNVSDRGDVLYEDHSKIVKVTGVGTPQVRRDERPGQFPVLMPDGKAYLYVDHGVLIRNRSGERRELIRVGQIVNGLRLSADGDLVAFGVLKRCFLESCSRLRICELTGGWCEDGPDGFLEYAGRDAFWVKR
jgi:hypothetical protein